MSVPVALAALADELARFPFGYLMTVSDDGRPHAVAVAPNWRGSELVVDVGRRTTANAAARPDVALVFPPAEPGGYSLIVDAVATAGADGVVLVPLNAVLHRPAPVGAVAEPGSCGADCVPIEVSAT